MSVSPAVGKKTPATEISESGAVNDCLILKGVHRHDYLGPHNYSLKPHKVAASTFSQEFI